RAGASAAADRATRDRHRRFLRGQPAGAEGAGGARQEGQAPAAAREHAPRQRSERSARGSAGGARHRPRGAGFRGARRMSGPDRTAKIIRALREVDGRSSARLIWPPPPYYEYQGEPPQAGEPALLTFTDGGKATGLVQTFLPEHEIVKFLPENGHSGVTIAFSSLLTVQLTEPVRIEAHTLPDGVNLQ